MDPHSVITLGHTLNVPLIRPRSELGYGLEPHGYFSSVTPWSGHPDYRHGGGRGVPGVAAWVGTRRVLYRVPSRGPDSGLFDELLV